MKGDRLLRKVACDAAAGVERVQEEDGLRTRTESATKELRKWTADEPDAEHTSGAEGEAVPIPTASPTAECDEG